ncbi:MAG: hypothetical protein JJU33_07610 [Phycisphaerales bacterium]|nr:hypothetical protein [Phycisphaerales bacterium]
MNRAAPVRVRLLWLALVSVAALGSACCSSAPRFPGALEAGRPVSAEAASSAVASYNAHIEQLDRLWARATVAVFQQDERGRTQRDQGEGFVQLVRPNEVSLSVGKYVDRMYFELGSNEGWYWWIDVLDRADSFALLGRHELATPELADRFGVPVHPLDLPILLGVEPAPADTEVRRVSGGRLVLSWPSRWGGSARVALDQLSQPVRVELWTADGDLAAASVIEQHQGVTVRGTGDRPRVGGRFEIDLPRIETQVVVHMTSPESSERRPGTAPFDLEGQLRRYRIPEDRIRLLDRPEDVERLLTGTVQ